MTRVPFNGNTMLVLFQLYTGLVQCPVAPSTAKTALNCLKLHGLAEKQSPVSKEWVLTPRGIAFVRMLLATPLPEQSWQDPRPFAERLS